MYKFKQNDIIEHINGKVRYKVLFRSVMANGLESYILNRVYPNKKKDTVTLLAGRVDKFYSIYKEKLDFSEDIKQYKESKPNPDEIWEAHKKFLGG